uniref:Uncharacterized protein n=1 Tax=Rhizophora mucronata TaxID=61149 RepID=A0A2P2QZ69_RHIMU
MEFLLNLDMKHIPISRASFHLIC